MVWCSLPSASDAFASCARKVCKCLCSSLIPSFPSLQVSSRALDAGIAPFTLLRAAIAQDKGPQRPAPSWGSGARRGCQVIPPLRASEVGQQQKEAYLDHRHGGVLYIFVRVCMCRGMLVKNCYDQLEGCGRTTCL